jgi:endonuclease G
VAAPTACPGHFFHGEPPALANPKLARDTRERCFSAFAVLHSGVTRTPLWSAEHLTADGIRAAEALPRKNSFHAEPSLPPDRRAELADYERSGYDRGHMAPDGDMPDAAAERESFSLANMVPQAPELNRGLWEGIEEAVRGLAVQDGEAYVVTGPIFAGEKLQALNGRVLVPTEVWKAVYVPKEGWAGVYLTENTNDSGWQAISLNDLEKRAGVDAFPSLAGAVKDKVGKLPAPRPHGRRGAPVAQASGAADEAALRAWLEHLVQGAPRPPLPAGPSIPLAEPGPTAPPPSPSPPPAAATGAGDAPLVLSDATFDQVVATSARPVLVDFWAPWCGPCRIVAPTVEQLAREFAGRAVVGKLNIDEHPRAAQRYGIMSIPALLIFKGGRVVERLVGAQPAPVLRQALAKHAEPAGATAAS